MTIVRWSIAGLLLMAALWLSIGNAVLIVRFILTRKRSSIVPLLGTGVAIVGLLILPVEGAIRYWWVPVVADLGSGAWLVLFPIFAARHAGKKRIE